MTNFKTSKLGRFAKISEGLAKASYEYAKNIAVKKIDEKSSEIKSLQAKIEATKELVKIMSEMKGGLMKLGQMISITDDMILPKEISDLFKKLQTQSTSMTPEEINSVFIKNFGKMPSDLFDSFEMQPIAAASIGQVHLAEHKGKKLAIKIQYPKIVSAIKSDLSNVHLIDKFINIIYPDKPNLDHMIEEIKRSLINECNYLYELENIKKFKIIAETHFKDRIIIPETIDEFCTEEILCMTYLEGDEFDHTLEYSQEIKNRLGSILYDFHLCCLFQYNILHTDPQNGNYKFYDEKIVLLDFGSVKIFEENFVDDYALLCNAIENDNLDLIKQTLINFHIHEDSDTPDEFNKSIELVKNMYEPFLKSGTYQIRDINPFMMVKNYIQSIKIAGRKAAKEEFLLLDRSNIGLFMKLQKWQAEVNWTDGRQTYQKPRELLALKKLPN